MERSVGREVGVTSTSRGKDLRGGGVNAVKLFRKRSR